VWDGGRGGGGDGVGGEVGVGGVWGGGWVGVGEGWGWGGGVGWEVLEAGEGWGLVVLGGGGGGGGGGGMCVDGYMKEISITHRQHFESPLRNKIRLKCISLATCTSVVTKAEHLSS